LFRSGEGLFGVHHPILFSGKSDVTQEGVAYAKWFQAGKELQFAGIEGLPEIIEEQATKQTRQDGNGQEEIRPAGHPSRAIRGNAATWNDAMQMRMANKSLAPGMEHSEESDLCAQMLGVSRNGAQGLGGGSEENVVDDLLVLQGNGGDGLRKSEDHMKILGVEKLGSPVFQPLGASQRLAFWTAAMTTAVVTDALVVTAIAALDMTAECCRSAQFDRTHDAPLCSA
jgi:hypothetical protein